MGISMNKSEYQQSLSFITWIKFPRGEGVALNGGALRVDC